MAIVAGVDFGTLSVRVSLVDSARGRIGSGVGEYPLHRKREDPDHATQSHADHMSALVTATRAAFAPTTPAPITETVAAGTPGTPASKMPRPSNGRSRYFAPS